MLWCVKVKNGGIKELIFFKFGINSGMGIYFIVFFIDRYLNVIN